eukprot:jgi/Tetstr1/455530/TSEL_042353.t1
MWGAPVRTADSALDALLGVFLPDGKKDDDADRRARHAPSRRVVKAALATLLALAAAFTLNQAVARQIGHSGGGMRLRVELRRGADRAPLLAAPLAGGHPAMLRQGLLAGAAQDVGAYAPPQRGAQWVTTAEIGAPGELVAAWVGKAPHGGRAADTTLYSASYSPESQRWSEPRLIAAVESHSATEGGGKRRLPVWYPVLCRLPGAGAADQLVLFYKTVSPDGGVTWGAATEMRRSPLASGATAAVRITGPYHACHVTQGPAGSTVLSPAGFANTASGGALVEFSQDGGQTWLWTSAIPYKGEGQLHHAAFFTDRAGGVRMLAQQRPTSRRGAPGGHVRALMATSDRLGLSWEEAREVELPSPDSPLDVLTLKDGRVLAAYNHAERPSTHSRAQLNLALSYDDGETWRPVLTLDADTEGIGMEFALPSVAQTSDGLLHVTYLQLPSLKAKKEAMAAGEGVRHAVLDPQHLDAAYLAAHTLRPPGVSSVSGARAHEDSEGEPQVASNLLTSDVGNAAGAQTAGNGAAAAGEHSRDDAAAVAAVAEAAAAGWLDHPDAAPAGGESRLDALEVIHDDDLLEFDPSVARLDTEGQPITAKIHG